MKLTSKVRNGLGWVAVILSLIMSLFWTYWGMMENFHEGWYHVSFWENLLLFLIQYIPFTIIFVGLPLVALRWKKIGLGLFIALGIFSAWFFSGASFQVVYLFIAIPLVALGLLFYFGEPKPQKIVWKLILFLPLSLMVLIGVPMIIKVEARLNDGDFGQRVVDCQGEPLVWAERGVGFPERGVKWAEASHVCQYLEEEGTVLAEEPQNVWRLPSIEEAVRCQMIHGENAGGDWDPDAERAIYEKTPDKETPLWDSHSEIIYYWTSVLSEENENRAYIIDYKGGVFEKDIRYSPAYRTFRCVKDYVD